MEEMVNNRLILSQPLRTTEALTWINFKVGKFYAQFIK